MTSKYPFYSNNIRAYFEAKLLAGRDRVGRSDIRDIQDEAWYSEALSWKPEEEVCVYSFITSKYRQSCIVMQFAIVFRSKHTICVIEDHSVELSLDILRPIVSGFQRYSDLKEIEIADSFFDAAGVSPEEVEDLVKEHGFELTMISSDSQN